MSPRRPKAELRLKLEGAASPERVEVAARLLKEAVRAASEDPLPPDSVTMVVSNRDMEARLRGWTQVAAEAVGAIADTIDDPLEAVQQRPKAKRIAAALAHAAPALRQAKGVFLRQGGRRPIARLDEDFVRVMEAASALPESKPPPIQGRTDVRSVVFRVGRVSAGAQMRARIILRGEPHEVAIAPGTEGRFFDAAKAGGDYRITIHAEWNPDERGAYTPDLAKVVALDLEPAASRLSGEEFLQEAPALSEESFQQIMDLLCEVEEGLEDS